ncbi:MAG: glycosyltransferase [Bacteroidota bacterium]
MIQSVKNKKCLLLLEFGIPHYRKFIYEYFQRMFEDFLIIHSGEKFGDNQEFKNRKGFNIKLPKEISLTFFNIFIIRNYDIIISTLNFRKPHTWLPFFLFSKKKWIFWGQGINRNNSRILNFVRKSIINKSVGYVAYTEKGRENLIKSGVLPEKILIAYNTLKINNAELTLGNKYLLYVGRIQKRKGLEKVIINLKNTDYKLLIVGNGNHIYELKKMTQLNKLYEQITYLPAIYDETHLKEIFSKAIAYISPSSVGLGVVHSFAYGVPVITCKNNNQGPEFEYCNESNSYLYNFDSDLREIIENVFQNKEERLNKGKSAFEYYKENLSHKNVYEAFNYHFKKIVDETNNPIV